AASGVAASRVRVVAPSARMERRRWPAICHDGQTMLSAVARPSAGAGSPERHLDRPDRRAPAPRGSARASSPTLAHLLPAFAAAVLLGVALAVGAAYAAAREAAGLLALGPKPLQQVDVGAAFQVAALNRPDVLLVFGASELGLGEAAVPSRLFRDAPTGFVV